VSEGSPFTKSILGEADVVAKKITEGL